MTDADLIFDCFVPGYSYYRKVKKGKDPADRRLCWAPVSKKEASFSSFKTKSGKLITAAYKDPYVLDWQKRLAIGLAKKIRNMDPDPEIPFDGPLLADMKFYLMAPKSLKFPPGLDIFPKDSVPDRDNLLKPVADVLDRTPEFLKLAGTPNLLKEPIIVNDSRIFSGRESKYWVRSEKQVGVRIRLWRLNIDRWALKHLED